MAHLFVDISAHGFGHLAQTAPVLNHLATLLPDLRITLRSGLPLTTLRQRIHTPFEHIAAASDFGFVMIDAVHIDLPASAAAYGNASADFASRVAADVRLLQNLAVDAVFANVSYLPLAGAAQAGIPAVAMCSLNWADLFAHFFADAIIQEPWAAALHAALLAAYRSATFLRTTPGMPMPALGQQIVIGPLADQGRERRAELRRRIGVADGNPGCGSTATTRLVLVALGGIPLRLPIETWPVRPATHWLVPAAWHPARADFHTIEAVDWPFVDLLHSVDAIVTKPGYGTFTEAVRNGAAVLYQRRPDWPEQDVLIDWLHAHGRAAEITAAAVQSGALGDALDKVTGAAVPPAPTFTGCATAAHVIAGLLR